MSADLEREAREQQKKAGFLAQPQDLYACQHEHGCAAFLVDEVTGYFDGQPCDCGANSRWGDLASKRMRANEQEIERLNELLKFTRKAAKEACADNDAEIATLRARVEELEGMVPKWADANEAPRLEDLGWLRAYDDKCGDDPRMWLMCMVPPIPAPETKA